MAQAKRRSRRYEYEVYGNVAYEPAWNGGAVAAPAPERQEVLQPRPHVSPRERTLARPRVQVRTAGAVSPFAVVGFLAIGVMAVLLLMSCVRLTVVNAESASLRSELARLEAQESELVAQYELAYDLRAIEEMLTADGTMVKPSANQMVVLDLSEPDNVVVYEQSEGAAGLLNKAGELLGNIIP